MAWPTTLSTDESLKKFSTETNLDAILDDHGDLSRLHQGAALEIRNWVEDKGTQADLITNTSAYEAAAAYWVLHKLFLSRKEYEKASEYSRLFASAVNRVRPRLSDKHDRGGNIATLGLFGPGRYGHRGKGKGRGYRRYGGGRIYG